MLCMLMISFWTPSVVRARTVCRNELTSSPMVMRPFRSSMAIPSFSLFSIWRLMSNLSIVTSLFNDGILRTRMPVENPFHDPIRFERRMPECTVVIFGANGDLTKRKLMPALYRLMYERRLSPGFAVVGISRTPMSDDQFRDKMRESVQKFLEDSPFDNDVWAGFSQGIFYMAGDVNDTESYKRLATRLKEIEESRHTGGNVLFY